MRPIDLDPIGQDDQTSSPLDLFLIFVGANIVATTLQILFGGLDLSTHDVETPGIVAARVRRALPCVSAERIILAPDCGMKYLSRDVAFAKLSALVEAARG